MDPQDPRDGSIGPLGVLGSLGLQHLHLHLPSARLNPNRPERKLPPLRKHREKGQREDG